MVLVKDFSKDLTNLRATRGRGMGEISSCSVYGWMDGMGWDGTGINRTQAPTVSLGVQGKFTARPEGPSLRMGWMDGWMDGWDGISKVSFKNLHTL